MNLFRTPMMGTAAVLALTCGCSSGDDDESMDSDDPMGIPENTMDIPTGSCEKETRAEAYSAGMAKTGTNGVNVQLTQAMPAPPARYDNTWTLTVTDGNDTPLAGATVAVDPRMPDHGHSSPKRSVVSDMGSGVYDVEPINFNMPGYWEVNVDVTTADNSMTDSVVFKVCIPG